MKIGTVLRNEYVSGDSPLRYSVYVGCDNKYIHTIYPYHGKIEKSRYYKEDVGEGITNILLDDIRRIENEVKVIEQPTEHSQS